MKTPQWDGSYGERVFINLGVIYVHGKDGEVWYMADPKVVNSSDISYMLENRPEKTPSKITKETIDRLREKPNNIEALDSSS